MNYLGKVISKIFLIDVFTPQERSDVMCKVTPELEKCIIAQKIGCISFYPNSAEEFNDCLAEIERDDLHSGTIIHFIGHGDKGQIGFGNTDFFIAWAAICERLSLINRACNDGLIMNTTCICYGIGIFTLLDGNSRPFYAAIGSTTKNSLRAWRHNKEVYEKCILKDNARTWWEHVSMGAGGNSDLYKINFS